MRRRSYKPYIFFSLTLFFLLSISSGFTNKLRSGAVYLAAPTWSGLKGKQKGSEIERLRLENANLTREIEALHEYLLSDNALSQQIKTLTDINEKILENPIEREQLKRRNKELIRAINLQMHAIPAKVIFREPGSWSSTLWINVGEVNNNRMGRPVVAENSPVLSGRSIVGVVEYVGKKQSRVRLLTESGLVPSVRIVRGSEQNRCLFEQVELIQKNLNLRDDLFEMKEEQDEIQQALSTLQAALLTKVGTRYLAKGELYGSGAPLWRSRGQVLKGVGFNYDFADDEGPARDLRATNSEPLLKEGDLLVTTGMDGIFPAGYYVGVVSHIDSLEEGGVAYDLDAELTAGNLDELTQVTVLPSLEMK